MGMARLPTAFIPNDDQGYVMIAVQLPDGASLGRTTDALKEATKIALAVPGVDQVIAISGMSAAGQQRDPCQWRNQLRRAEVLEHSRQGQEGEDILSIIRRLCRRELLKAAPDGQGVVLVPPPIQGIGNAGGLQMQVELLGGSFDYCRLLADMTDAVVKK